VINDICELSEANVCRIMLIDENKREATNYCEAISEEYDVSNYEGDGVIPYETVKSWEDMIGDQNIVVAKNDYEMDDLERRNPAWVREMRSYDVDSIVMLPLQCDKNIVGYLYVVNFNTDNFVATKELLEMMAFILGSEIFNYQTIKRLERMSVEDELTGLLNRNALSIRAGELINDAKMLPFGIVDMDLNGLKEVNDRMGHDAGDEMLRRSAALMKEIFKECEIYRAGGDEFITLMMDTDKESFEKRVEVFHRAEEQESSFDLAIGSFWAETEEDLDKAFVTADMRMYADKKAFYEKHPEKDRRNHV
jgi:diguanylate cyclase (GGDEF)-like protein